MSVPNRHHDPQQPTPLTPAHEQAIRATVGWEPPTLPRVTEIEIEYTIEPDGTLTTNCTATWHGSGLDYLEQEAQAATTDSYVTLLTSVM